MFSKDLPGNNLLNPDCQIYKEIAKIASVMRAQDALRFGRMYFRQNSGDGIHFGLPYGKSYTLAFSRILYGSEVLVAYNVSEQTRNDCIIVDSSIHKPGDIMNFIYGNHGGAEVKQSQEGSLFVQLELSPGQFYILK